MRSILSERNVVVVLFVMVLITFSLAQEDSKKMEKMYSGTGISAISHQILVHPDKSAKNNPDLKTVASFTTAE
jgi:hypothetical protein